MTRLSNRQYPMLRAFAEERSDYFMTQDDAKHFDQRPFRSMLIQGWISYRPGRGFHITKDGLKAWSEFLNTDIARKDFSRPLTKYFDETAYRLRRKGAA